MPNELRELSQPRTYPAVSIVFPTEYASPQNRQNPIRLRNAVDAVTDRLMAEFSRGDILDLLDQLSQAAEEVDFRRVQEGLVVLVDRTEHHVFYLPGPVTQQIVVNQSFVTRDLIRAQALAQPYWLLVLSEKPSRLYRGERAKLTLVEHEDLPMIDDGPGGTEALPGGFGQNPSATLNERHRQFFRDVRDAVGEITKGSDLPLVVLGIERYQAFWNEVAGPDDVAVRIPHNFDYLSDGELGARVWPDVAAYFDAQRTAALRSLDDARSAKKFAGGLQEIWPLAKQGQVAALLIEDSYTENREMEPEKITDATEPEPGEAGPVDTLDDLIGMVYGFGGTITFVNDGALANEGRVAAILRFE